MLFTNDCELKLAADVPAATGGMKIYMWDKNIKKICKILLLVNIKLRHCEFQIHLLLSCSFFVGFLIHVISFVYT